MYCLTNLCYVCLKTKNNLTNINNSYSYDQKLLRIIDCFAFDLSWLRNRSIILICEECCVKLRESYQFMEMCHHNSAILQGYVSLLDYSPISDNSNEAKLSVMLDDVNNVNNNFKLGVKEEHDNCLHNIQEEQITLIKLCDIQEEISYADESINEEISCTDESINEEISCTDESINEEISRADESINEEIPRTNTAIKGEKSDILMEYSDIKKEITYENEVSNVEVEYETSHVKAEKTDSEILPYDHSDTNINDGGNSNENSNQVYTPSNRNIIKPVEKIFQCSMCVKCFAKQAYVRKHMKIHSGQKPYQCSTCPKRYTTKTNLRKHILIHPEENP